jgi:hypothetical protein
MLKIAIKRLGFAGVATVGLFFSTMSAQASEISPFDLIKDYKVEKRTKNYAKLSAGLSAEDAQALDQSFSEHFGSPAVKRNGVKVWEIPNDNAQKGQADLITVTCGPDGTGYIISVDARGPGEGNRHQKALHDKKLKNAERKAQRASTARLENKSESKSRATSRVSQKLKPHLRDDAN